MPKKLIIVFVKNILLGKVKTRLAKTIGKYAAFEIYKELVEITEKEVLKSSIDKSVYFSDVIIEEKFQGCSKYVQDGADLGERMLNAFKAGFDDGYDHIVLVGSDLPNIDLKYLEQAFNQLKKNDFSFGPAKDGGYYLISMKKAHEFPFKNKAWSQPELYQNTKAEIEQKGYSLGELTVLNDIDTWEDYKASTIFEKGRYQPI